MNPIAEDRVFVEFYTDAVELKYRSEEEGRPGGRSQGLGGQAFSARPVVARSIQAGFGVTI